MTREQLSIAGTEPARNPAIDEALFAMLNAQQEQRAAGKRKTQWLASLQTRCTEANITRYPYTDPETGKQKLLTIGAKIDMKTSKAPPERKRRSKRGRAKDGVDRDDADEDRDAKPADASQPPDSLDPFEATRAKLRVESGKPKPKRGLLDEAAEDEHGDSDDRGHLDSDPGVDAQEVESRFALLDRVTWSSSANGTTKRKTGAVIAVIPAGKRPGEVCEKMRATRFASTRDHVSYGVEVNGEMYWPKVAALKPAKGKR
jgi:hypothetical protein